MKCQYDYILEYLKNKTESKFTGAIRISYEKGKVVLLNEASSFDIETDVMNEGNLEKIFREALSDSFFGYIVIEFKDGVKSRYGFSRSYRGDDLKKILGQM